MFPSASSVGFPRNASCHAGGYWAEPAAVPVGWDDESAAGRCQQLAAARNARQSSSAHEDRPCDNCPWRNAVWSILTATATFGPVLRVLPAHVPAPRDVAAAVRPPDSAVQC